MTRGSALIFLTMCLGILLGPGLPAHAESDWRKLKAEFSEEYKAYKRGGLSAAEVKQLTQDLLSKAGDDVDGTGLKALLESMNEDPERAARVLGERAAVEQLIDAVGTASALANVEDPIDELVDAYNALADDMRMFADYAKFLPGGERVAPLLNANATMIENGKANIKTIAGRARETRDSINTFDDMVYGENNDAPPASALKLAFAEAPTGEEIEWEKLRRQEKAQDEACIERCRDQYRAYNQIANRRARARDVAAVAGQALEPGRKNAEIMRLDYNDHARRFNSYLEGYVKTLAKRDTAKMRLLRAEQSGERAAYDVYKQSVDRLEASLTRFRKNMRADYADLKKAHDGLVRSKSNLSALRAGYDADVQNFRIADTRYRAAVKAYEACVEVCRTSVASQPQRTRTVCTGGGLIGGMDCVEVQMDE